MRPLRPHTLSRPLPVLAAFALLALAALAFLNGCAKARPAPPPLPADEAALPDSLKREPVVMLSDSTAWSVETRRGKNLLVRRNVTWYRVNRRSPPLLERIEFYENEILMEPVRASVEAWYPDRDRWRADEGEFTRQEIGGHALMLATGGTLLAAKVPRYGEGVVLRVESVETYVRPEFRSQDMLRGDYPCLRRHVSFRAPEGHGFRVGLGNREGLEVAADTSREGGRIRYAWSARDLPRLVPERRPRHAEDWYAGIFFSVPPRGTVSWTWREIGDHYLEMIKDAVAPSPDLKAAAAGLGEGDGEAISERAFRLVKARIRYLGDTRGINAWVPRPVRTVWDNGYGDCKEMANVLRALLAEKGVAGGIALVRAGTGGSGQVREDYPALSPFDHAVYWRRRADGSTAVLDPTMPGDMGASSYLPILGQKLLVIGPGISALDTVKPAPGFRNRVATASVLSRGGDGGWELRGKLTLAGKVAQELWLPLRFTGNREEARIQVGAFLAERFGLETPEFDWRAPAADSLEIDYRLPAQGMALPPDGRGLSLGLPWICGSGRPPGPGENDGPWQGFRFEQSDTWTLPEGYGRLKGGELAGPRARGRWSMAGRAARRDYVLAEPDFAPEETDAIRILQESLSRFTTATAWR